MPVRGRVARIAGGGGQEAHFAKNWMGRYAPVDNHQDRRTIVLPHGKTEHGRLDALQRAWTPTAEESGRARDYKMQASGNWRRLAVAEDG